MTETSNDTDTFTVALTTPTTPVPPESNNNMAYIIIGFIILFMLLSRR